MAEERETQVRLNLQVNQQQRLETETQDEREVRLHGLRVSQQQRLAAETPEERRQLDRQSQAAINYLNVSHFGAHSQTRGGTTLKSMT